MAHFHGFGSGKITRLGRTEKVVEDSHCTFNQVCERGGEEKAQLLRCLKKVGLVMHNGPSVYSLFRKVDRRAAAVSEEQMAAELEYFETDEDHGLCGETVSTTDMYRVDVHCSHRVILWRRNL
jgi:hypothetical protein